MALKRSTALKNAMLATGSFKSIMDGGVLVLFSGTQPADADASENLYNESTNPTGCKELLRVTLSGDTYAFDSGANGLTFGDAVDGEILKAANVIWSGFGNAICGTSGVAATWFRFYAKGGNAGTELSVSSHFGEDTDATKIRFDGSCGSYGDLKMVSTNIIQGQSCTLDTFRLALSD